jgi:hypothetical protein
MSNIPHTNGPIAAHNAPIGPFVSPTVASVATQAVLRSHLKLITRHALYVDRHSALQSTVWAAGVLISPL